MRSVLNELIEAYGYEVSEVNEMENRMRYRNENGGFIDFWWGKRGITVGVYDQKTKRVKYLRRPDACRLEDEILRVK